MGSFFSKYTTYSITGPGDGNTISLTNGVSSGISSMFNQTIQNAIKQVENIIIANNASIIINIVLILIFIIFLLTVLYVRCQYQQFSLKMNSNDDLQSKKDEFSTFYDKSSSTNIANDAEGYLV